MGILSDYNLNDLPETGAVAPGEYEVVIQRAELYTGKTSGKTSIRVQLDIPEDVNADTIFHYISLPNDSDTPKQQANKLRRMKEFLQAFDLDQDMDFPDWVGHKSWALIATGTDQEGRERNEVKRFLGRSDNSSIPAPTSNAEAIAEAFGPESDYPFKD